MEVAIVIAIGFVFVAGLVTRFLRFTSSCDDEIRETTADWIEQSRQRSASLTER